MSPVDLRADEYTAQRSVPAPAPPFRSDYELTRCIGRGGYGEVWLARGVTGSWHALKLVRRRSAARDKAFDREFRGIQNYEPVSRADPSLMSISHVGSNDGEGFFYYVMELADDSNAEGGVRNAESGGNVSGKVVEWVSENGASAPTHFPTFSPTNYIPKTLRHEIQTRGRLPFKECVELGLALTTALKVLHERKLLHRDIKPSNIIYVGGRPKLADIGLVAPADATLSGLVGTTGYLAPEGASSPQSDLYSLGKVLYEACTGKDRQQFPEPPTTVETDEDFVAMAEFNEIVLKACAHAPRDRYTSAAEMGADLLLIRSGRSVRRQQTLERRLRGARFAILILAVLAALGYGGLAIRTRFAEAQVREQRQKTLLQQLVTLRLTPHEAGWSQQAWALAQEAATYQRDEEMLAQAAATLSGLEARLTRALPRFPGVSVSFDAAGDQLVIASPTNGATLWNPGSGVRESFSSGIGVVAFSREGVALHAAPGPESIRLSKRGDVMPMHEFLFSREHGARKLLPVVPGTQRVLKFNTLASVLGAAGIFDDGSAEIAVWDVATGRRTFEQPEAVRALAFSEEGEFLAALGSGGNVIVWDLRHHQRLAELSVPPSDGRIHCLALTQDTLLPKPDAARGDHLLLATGGSAGAVTLWNVGQRQVRSRLRGSQFDVYALAFSPDRTMLASAGRGPARFWNVATDQLMLTLPTHDYAQDLRFSADGRRLAVVNLKVFGNAVVSVWELEQTRGIHQLRGLSSSITKVCMSSDEHRIAALAQDWTIGVWDWPSGRLRCTINTPGSQNTADNAALTLNEDGSKLAFAAGSTAKLWNLDELCEAGSWKLPPGIGDTAGFHPSGKLLLFRREGDDVADATNVPVKVSGLTHFRIRDLLGTEPLRPLAEIPAFDSGFYSVQSPANAAFFLVEGLDLHGTNRVRGVKLFDGQTGSEVWSEQVAADKPAFAGLVVDSAGDIFAYQPERVDGCVVRQWPSAAVASRLPFVPVALAPRASLRVTRSLAPDQKPRGFYFHRSNESHPFMNLSIDAEPSTAPPVLNAGGSLMIWGQHDGTVTVADLHAAQESLAKFARQK